MTSQRKAYWCDLGGGQQLQVETVAAQTIVTLSRSAAGQQQSQTSRFATGEWLLPPTLLHTAAGFILRIEAAQGQTWLQVQGNSIQVLATVPPLAEAEVLLLQTTQDNSLTETLDDRANPLTQMSPATSLPPLKMGDMEMQMNPMRMRMGDLELQMGKPEPELPHSETSPSPSVRSFCSQCGKPIESSDRFCSNCGYQLQQ